MDVLFHDTPDAYEREYQRVRAAFIADGTTLSAYLEEQGIARQVAYRALQGRSLGKRSVALRKLLLREADMRMRRSAHA